MDEPICTCDLRACRVQRDIQVASIEVEAAKEQYGRDVKTQVQRGTVLHSVASNTVVLQGFDPVRSACAGKGFHQMRIQTWDQHRPQ